MRTWLLAAPRTSRTGPAQHVIEDPFWSTPRSRWIVRRVRISVQFGLPRARWFENLPWLGQAGMALVAGRARAGVHRGGRSWRFGRIQWQGERCVSCWTHLRYLWLSEREPLNGIEYLTLPKMLSASVSIRFGEAQASAMARPFSSTC